MSEPTIDPDWCAECGCPVGVGDCGGCIAVSCCEAFDPPPPEAYCPHCGKEYEDWSDLGCGRCDSRHHEYGVL